MIAPHINTVAKTYELAHVPEHRDVMTAVSHLTGERTHRYTHIFQNADDLVKKIQMLRLLGQTTGTCFQRCVGLDALNAIYATSWDIDQAKAPTTTSGSLASSSWRSATISCSRVR